ncbi:hypothetical protein [Actinoplanes sp. NPDC051494]|uniref:hypothetical protein n=1 Tax=Actinoplanes sp. NPDC051494 TaxID=3363907 RepID=UPI0037B357AA
MSKIRGIIAGALVGLTALVIVPQPAQASASKCVAEVANSSCLTVSGTGLQVNWFKSKVGIFGNNCFSGHSQILINGKHFADSNGGGDRRYCGFAEVKETGIWYVNRKYAKGTQICAKFWRLTGTGPNNGYLNLGTACAKIG